MILRHRTILPGFVALYAVLTFPLFVTSVAHASGVVECIAGQFNYTLIDTIPYPETTAQAKVMIARLEKSVYKLQVLPMKNHVETLSADEREALWRMANKTHWRHAEETSADQLASRRITMNTNQRRNAHQDGGWDESPDPAPPFEMKHDDPRPAGMPVGVYQLSSGNHAYLFKSLDDSLKNKSSEAFEIVYQQQTKDGRWVTQAGGYAAPDSSRGWDGRFEIQPDGKGGHQLVITQGAMELTSNLRGAAADSRILPHVSEDNQTRSRHIFTPVEWIPAKKGKRAQLVVRDQGSILNMEPSVERRWIEIDDKSGKLLHAHGYGENFVPDPVDPRKMWVDPDGYTWRIFDMVTAETKIKNPDGTFKYIPTETRAVAYRMDPKNPSKRVPDGVLLPNGKPASAPVFLTHNHDPVTNEPIPATVRYAFDTSGHAVEKRSIQEDGSVKVITENVPQNERAVLNEGFNLLSGTIKMNGEEYYVGTNSAGEYTSGGVPKGDKDTQYGTYLWVRKKKDGPIGPYTPIMTDDGKDFQDMTKVLTQMYGLSWGVGRGQPFREILSNRKLSSNLAGAGATTAVKKGIGPGSNTVLRSDDGRLWLKAHGVDVDLLESRLPQHGYPKTSADFANRYRRHQLTIPISFSLRNGKPYMEIDDPKVAKDYEEWKKRRAAAQAHAQ